MQNLITGLFLAIAAGCATLSPIPPPKAATKAPTAAQCDSFEKESRQHWICLYQVEVQAREADAKELAALKAERTHKRQAQNYEPAPVLAVNVYGRVQSSSVQTEPSTTRPPSGQGIAITNLDRASRVWDASLVGCVIRTNGPQQVVGTGVQQVYLDPDGRGAIPIPRGCARATSTIFIADVPYGEYITVQYAKPVPGDSVGKYVVERTCKYKWLGSGWNEYNANAGECS